MGGIIAGLEAGFVLPAAGGDVQWLEENWEEFNRRAEAGDEEMKGMVKEIQERGLLDGTNGLMTQQKKLEASSLTRNFLRSVLEVREVRSLATN